MLEHFKLHVKKKETFKENDKHTEEHDSAYRGVCKMRSFLEVHF
jgi:hypothetical protein